MTNTYNIYKVKHQKLDQLKEKLKAVGLIEQKTQHTENYAKTFYYSQNNQGNDVWWWATYRQFFSDGVPQPKNIFNFAMLLCQHNKNPETVYAVSLGKSHFYLSKFIHLDFGIDLAIRMADENSILLKKSRYFTGTKRQDVSSYQEFQADSYDPGESVDHLKLKAADREIWGNRNIIFADSIQMDMDRQPLQLSEIFDQIEEGSKGQTIIRLPKLEPVKDELAHELDAIAFRTLKAGDGRIHVDEFQVHGVAICFSFHDYDYRVSARTPNKWHRQPLGNTLEIEDISAFIKSKDDITDINELSIQFQSEDAGAFTKPFKELLDFPVTYDDAQYFLKNGEWFFFNQPFMEYLKQSLESILTVKEEDLIEKEYQAWKVDKTLQIEAETAKDRLVYREAWFNQKICEERNYLLLDRQLEAIQAIALKKKDYKVEIADIYKDGEVISVKISESNPELIYNVEQSKVAIGLLKRNVIKFDQEIRIAALWFAFERDVNKITDFNSIQFLLSVESWHKQVKSLGLTPKIYISKHVKGNG